MRRAPGFTLVELLVTVVIAAIVAMASFQAYTATVHKSRRADAHVALTTLALRLQRCFTQFGRYDDADCAIAASQDSPLGFYAVDVARRPDGFVLTALPRGAQRQDLRCASLIIDEVGNRRATGADPQGCW